MAEQLKLPWWNKVLKGRDDSDYVHNELIEDIYFVRSLKPKNHKKNVTTKTAWNRKG